MQKYLFANCMAIFSLSVFTITKMSELVKMSLFCGDINTF